MNTSLHEIYSTIYWNILRESVPGFVKALGENIASHRTFSHEGMPGSFLTRSKGFEPMDATYVTDNPERDCDSCWGWIDDEDEFIDLIPVNGGITRNAACGFGSRAQRDQVLYASKKPNCIGHIFLIDTPGGSAYSIEDYTEAIEAARSAGQPVIACIDGLCASAGYALACQCDNIYYTSPGNIVGCIGTMAIFATNKNGDINSITQETFHEIYDPESTEKNLEFRQSAEGDDTLIIEHLKECGQAFRDLVSKCRPQVLDEQKKGKTYKCSEVEGTLVDGRLSLQGCIDLLVANAEQPAQPERPDTEEPMNPESPDGKCNPNKDETDDKCNPKKTNCNMIENNIQTALIEAQSALAEKETELAEAKTTLAEKENLLAEANKSLEDAESAKASAIAEAVAEKDALLAEMEKNLSEINATLEETSKSLEEANNTLSVSEKSLVEAKEALASSNQLLEERASRIAELEASLAEANSTIEELSHEPSATPQPAPATAENGEGDGEAKTPETACASKSGMTLAERRKAQANRDAELAKATRH